VSESRIEELLDKAGLSDLLLRSANADEDYRGIKMKITEGGKNLSSGER
jgi:ABC-type multidrug transport system fused ATPase/permease subunit